MPKFIQPKGLGGASDPQEFVYMIARQLSTCDLYVRRIPTFTPSFPCCPNSPRSGATLISNTGLKNICADLWGAFLLFFATVFVC